MFFIKSLITILCLCIALSINAEPKQLKIGTQNIAMPPYFLIDEPSGDMSGLIIDVLNQLEAQLSIDVSVVSLPHVRAIRDLKSGSIDGFIAWSWESDRTDFVSYPMKDGKLDKSRSIFTESYVFYALKSSGLSWDGEKFNTDKVVVGVNQLYSIYNHLKELNLNIDGAKYDTTTNLERLSLGRISAAVTLESLGDNVIKANKNFRENIIKLSPAVLTKEYYLVLSKRFVAENPELAEKIWDALKLIRSRLKD